MARLYCGTSGWNYPHWKDRFYPAKMRQDQWLQYYTAHFDTVEINYSFYRLPEKETFERWRERAPQGFVFAVKASRYLTHIKRLQEPEEPLARILANSEGLGHKRGPILYQFPPGWSLDLDRLQRFLSLLPSNVRHAFEFRNSTWHTDSLWSLLERYSVAYCIMDSPGLPFHLKTTASFSYIRMHWPKEPTDGCYSDEQLSTWASRIEAMLDRGDVYVYFNNDYRGYAVTNALALKELLGGRP